MKSASANTYKAAKEKRATKNKKILLTKFCIATTINADVSSNAAKK
jgi:hypothetical protein